MKKLICFILLSSLFFLSCSKKLITNESDDLVKPSFKNNKTLQVAEIIVEDKTSPLYGLKGAFTQYLTAGLIDLKTIQNSLEQSSASNEDKLLQSYYLFQKSKKEKNKIAYSDMLNSSTDVFSLVEREKDTANSNTLDKLSQEMIFNKNKKKYLLKYYKLYNEKRIDFKPYLGININKPLDQEVQIRTLTVQDSILKMDTKNVFQISQIYDQLEKNKADYVLLGKMKQQGLGIVITLKLYDRYLKEFIWSGEFNFNKETASINMQDNVNRITSKLKDNFRKYPKGNLIVKTEPEGAYVFLNGKNLGKSNLNEKVPVGYHEIEILKKDYSKKKKKIFISQNKKHIINLKLSKSEKKGAIAIQSEPSGADVFLDLDYKGQTPLILDDVPIGSYKVRLEKAGYKHSYSNVTVKEEKKQLLSFTMNEGKTVYTPVENLSEDYNTAKNLFLYSSFISLTAMLYAYLEADKYYDRYKGEVESGTSTTSSRVQDLYRKYQNAKEVRDITVGTSIGLIILTTIFQVLELQAEDIEVGVTPKEADHNNSEKDVGANLKVNYKF